MIRKEENILKILRPKVWNEFRNFYFRTKKNPMSNTTQVCRHECQVVAVGCIGNGDICCEIMTVSRWEICVRSVPLRKRNLKARAVYSIDLSQKKKDI
jgi:hypothetical protein